MKKRILILSIIVIGVFLVMLGVRTIVTSAKQEREAAKPKRICYEVHVVSSNETLWSISEKNASRLRMDTRSYVDEIKKANSMKTDKILVGGKLILPYGIYD